MFCLGQITHPAATPGALRYILNATMSERRFPSPWSVEELDAMTKPTKSKIEAIKPDEQDFDAVGPLPPNASRSALAERYRLAQAGKIIRQLEQIGAVQTDL